MRVRERTRLAAALTVAVALGGAARLAAAQESPDAVTPEENRCETQMSAALARYVGDVATCQQRCLAKYPVYGACNDLSLSTTDPVFLGCLASAALRAAAATGACAGTACPECYRGGIACAAFRDARFAAAISDTWLVLPTLYCDDAASADGLSAAEASCRRSLVAAGTRVVSGVAGCLARCHQAARRAGTSEDACAASAIGTPALDAPTARCIGRVRAKHQAVCEKRCSDAPDCLPFALPAACGVLADLFATPTAAHVDELLCHEPTCGDAVINGAEQCDVLAPWDCSAYVSGASYCSSQCTCEPLAYCGDGKVGGDEYCDPSAVPDGCPAGTTCLDCFVDGCAPSPD
jgi:hypothetical protein